MAKLAIALEIGGAVAASLGAAFGTARGISKSSRTKGSRAKVLKNTIGETIKLRDEWKKAHDSGSAAASGLLRRLEGNLDVLKNRASRSGAWLGSTSASGAKRRQQICNRRDGSRSMRASLR